MKLSEDKTTNYSVNIYKLPPEVMLEIFKVIPDYYELIFLVCRYWYGICKNNLRIFVRNRKPILDNNWKPHYSPPWIYGESSSLTRWGIKNLQISRFEIAESAAGIGSLDIINRLHDDYWEDFAKWSLNICDVACEFGHLDIIEYIYRARYPISTRIPYIAVENGHLDILKWFMNVSSYNSKYYCSLDYNSITRNNIIVEASTNGYVNILDWINTYNNKTITVSEVKIIIRMAAYNGQIKVFRWLLESISLIPLNYYFNSNTFELAVRGKKRNMLTFLKIYNCSYCNNTCLGLAASEGDLEMLKYLINYGLTPNSTTYEAAAEKGQLHIIQWLVGQGFHWYQKETCIKAALHGHLDVLKWLHSHGGKLNQHIFDASAESGNIEMMEWLKDNNCEWGMETCVGAVKSGQLEVLEWLRENNCPWDETTCITAYTLGHIDILEWISNNSEFPEFQ